MGARRRLGNQRLIPAHAGKTSQPSRRPVPLKAHPRSRGENVQSSDSPSRALGSSPLTRGKPRSPRYSTATARLIPAHAGKTQPPGLLPAARPAHPRSRGENASSSMPIKSAYGSSPLTRGKHVATPSWAARPRLIPAHAGKTNTLITTMFYNKAHPRSRGENTALVSQRFQFGNSSPLTRGKLFDNTGKDLPFGLIPAHAGKTYLRAWV